MPQRDDALVRTELVQSLRRALRSDNPVDFLLTAAGVHTVIEEGSVDRDRPEGWVGLLDSLCEIDIAETTALLHVVAALTRDELTRARLGRVLQTRRQPLPEHVRTLGQLRVSGTRIMGGDPAGDNIIVGLVWPYGQGLTLVAYLPRQPDVYLKDAFLIPDHLEVVEDHFRRSVAQDGGPRASAPAPLPPAEARAALERGLHGYDTIPDAPRPDDPPELQQWPTCRALVEHVITLLPPGGRGYDADRLLPGQQLWDPWDLPDEELDPEELGELVEEFLDSRYGRRLPHRDELTTSAAAVLMALAHVAEGDALHWCPDVLEWVLTEALPADPLLDGAVVERAVEVLPELVRWAGEQQGDDPAVADALLQMVPGLARRFRERLEDPEVQEGRAAAALAASLFTGDADAIRRALVELQVGGRERAERLTDEPLPTEGLILDDLPEDVHDRAREVDAALLAGLEKLDDPHLGEEFLTACRRFLVRAVEREPGVLRRRAKAVNTAAAVAWTVGRANELVGHSPSPVRSGDLMAAFGVATPSGRAETLQRAFGATYSPFGVALGHPEVLVGATRRELLRRYRRDGSGRG